MNQSNDTSMVDDDTLLACVRAGGETGALASAEIKRRLAAKQPDEAAVERAAQALCDHGCPAWDEALAYVSIVIAALQADTPEDG